MISMVEEMELWPVNALIPYARNPRKNEHAVDDAVAIIKEFGFRIPMIIKKSDGSIVDGHLRLKAAHKLGLEKVPVVFADDLSDIKIKALRLSVNKMAKLADDDDELLKLEVQELSLEGYNPQLTGYSGDEIQRLMAPDKTEGLTDPDDAPNINNSRPPVSKDGDVWILGNHRVICGDSTNPADYQLLMKGQKADLVLTDPPYNVAYVGKTDDALTIQNDKMSDAGFYDFLLAFYQNAYQVSKDGAAIYVFHADSEGANFRLALKNAKWKLAQCCVWIKNSLVMGRQDYHWRHEPCLYGWKDTAAHNWYTDRKQDTVWQFNRPTRNAEHPTMKPIDLIEYPMMNSSKPGDLVLDCFLGSGSTLIAAEKNGRVCFGFEKDPQYCDVVVRRWQAFTGKAALRESDSAPFDSL